jgi:hypothetical protein
VVFDVGDRLVQGQAVEVVAQRDALVERGVAAEFEVAFEEGLAEQDQGQVSGSPCRCW